jgi:predicted dehydrogenase/acetyltransferase-like isoleucine patch superfamily enzyme
VAVVGCGYWGRNLVRNFSELGALEALVDVSRSTVDALVAKHGGRRATLAEVLNDRKIDAVVVATPAAQHHSVAMQALEAGKHVFVEKPLALDIRDAEQLVARAERADKRLMVGHLLQYHPAFIKLKELLRNGELGRLQYVYSNRVNLGKIRREEDVLWSFAPHDISMILSLVGQEPTEVSATGSYYLHDCVADVTMTQLSFAGGERAHIFVSWLHPFKEQKLVVVGSTGMAVFDDSEAWASKLVLYKHELDWLDGMPMPRKADGVAVELDKTEPLKAECRHFLECVSGGYAPRTDGREGMRVLSVLERASKALVSDPRAERRFNAPAAKSGAEQRFSGVRLHETVYVDDAVEIGEHTSIWHFSHILSRVKIGANCVLGQNVVVGPDVSIGDRCKIQNNVSVYKGVTLEDGVFCGPSCVFTNVNNPRAEIERKDEFRPTLVRKGATIGANATIVCGHTIGAYAFIAAGAVVTKDVPDFALMAGNPARRIGWMSRAGVKLNSDLVCPSTHIRYREAGPDQLIELQRHP